MTSQKVLIGRVLERYLKRCTWGGWRDEETGSGRGGREVLRSERKTGYRVEGNGTSRNLYIPDNVTKP